MRNQRMKARGVDCYSELGFLNPRVVRRDDDLLSMKAFDPAQLDQHFMQRIRMYHPEVPREQRLIHQSQSVQQIEKLELSWENSSGPLINSDEEKRFENINFAYQTLKDPRKRYKYDHFSAGYFDIEIPQFVHGIVNDPGYQQRKLRDAVRNSQLKAAMSQASWFEKLRAMLASLFYGISVATIGLITTVGIAAVIAVGLVPFWFNSNWAPKTVTRLFETLTQFFELGNDKSCFKPLLVGVTKLLVTLGILIALPFIAFVLTAGSVYAGGSNGYHAYKEITARGMTKQQKIVLASCVAAVCAILLVVFPPAGAVALLGAGGWVATTVGMSSLSLPSFAMGFSALVGAATGVVSNLFSAVHSLFKKCCRKPKPRYQSLNELAQRGLYQQPAAPLSLPTVPELASTAKVMVATAKNQVNPAAADEKTSQQMSAYDQVAEKGRLIASRSKMFQPKVQVERMPKASPESTSSLDVSRGSRASGHLSSSESVASLAEADVFVTPPQAPEESLVARIFSQFGWR